MQATSVEVSQCCYLCRLQRLYSVRLPASTVLLWRTHPQYNMQRHKKDNRREYAAMFCPSLGLHRVGDFTAMHYLAWSLCMIELRLFS